MSKPLGGRLGLILLLAAAATAGAGSPAMAQPCAGAQATLCALNAQRESAGLPPLALDPRLTRAARARARNLSHPPAGSPPAGELAGGLGDATIIRPGHPLRELAPGADRTLDAGAACANRELAPATGTLGAIGEATLCLLNGVRTDRGLPRLTADARLASAATAYAGDLVAGQYFSHAGRDGSDLLTRIVRSGYPPGDAGYALGENLAWGTGPLATPASIMQAWMRSAGHRHNILNPEFREVGIGVAPGNPAARNGLGATYATEFGGIDGASCSARALERRVARTGWLHHRPRWLLGETVAWAPDAGAPEAAVAAWMRSAPHRRVALRPAFRRVGIAVAPGAPFGAGTTFVADFGAALKRRAADGRGAAATRSPRTTRTSSSAAG
jgi:uncharacterized protein YkwD